MYIFTVLPALQKKRMRNSLSSASPTHDRLVLAFFLFFWAAYKLSRRLRVSPFDGFMLYCTRDWSFSLFSLVCESHQTTGSFFALFWFWSLPSISFVSPSGECLVPVSPVSKADWFFCSENNDFIDHYNPPVSQPYSLFLSFAFQSSHPSVHFCLAHLPVSRVNINLYFGVWHKCSFVCKFECHLSNFSPWIKHKKYTKKEPEKKVKHIKNTTKRNQKKKRNTAHVGYTWFPAGFRLEVWDCDNPISS